MKIPFEYYQDSFTDEWYFHVWDEMLHTYRDEGPFETKEQMELAVMRYMQHE
jgi:hypothetical protein